MRTLDVVSRVLVCSSMLACGGGGNSSASASASASSTSGGSTGEGSGAGPTGEAGTGGATGGSGSGDVSSGGAATGSTGAPTSTSAAGTSTSTTTDASSSGGETAGSTGDGVCGDVFTDPNGDGSLRLSGDEVFVLGPGPYTFSSICVQDNAHLLVCDETTIFLGDAAPTVIEGLGIGSIGQNPVKVNLHLEPNVGPYYIYFDATQAKISLLLFATGADIVYALHGMAGVFIDGQNMQNSATYQAGEPNFPACP